jgi:nucleotide-binding universal stress UspA family protein
MKILVADEFAKRSKGILTLACRYAKAFQAQVLLVTSLVGGAATTDEDVMQAQSGLEEAQAKVAGEGVSCEIHLLVRGVSPGEDLVAFAREHGVDEIIIGVRKTSKVGKLLFGSTAQYVILHADCPVTTLK